MKPSKYALFHIILGFAVFIISAILSLIANDQVRSPILLVIGLSAMNLLWIMALQIDLYKMAEKKE